MLLQMLFSCPHNFTTSASVHVCERSLRDKSQTRSSEPVRSVSSTWCVCILGGICLCKCTAGIEQGSPHSSLLKHFQRERHRGELPILCSLTQTREEGGIYPGIWFLGSTTAQCSLSLSLSLSLCVSGSLPLTHTYTPGQWLDFNMVMIRDGGLREGRGGGGGGGSYLLQGNWGRCDVKTDREGDQI